jgi:hypothetical protein
MFHTLLPFAGGPSLSLLKILVFWLAAIWASPPASRADAEERSPGGGGEPIRATHHAPCTCTELTEDRGSTRTE